MINRYSKCSEYVIKILLFIKHFFWQMFDDLKKKPTPVNFQYIEFNYFSKTSNVIN